jgi:outer membrane protein assembly factor BamB
MSIRRSIVCTSVLFAAALALVPAGRAADWPRFRGDNGAGVAGDAESTPTEWSDTTNLRWSVDLPGQGVSCPIVVGDRVIVTSWSGEGADDLVRHLTCYDRRTGDQIWSKDLKPATPDESYDGMFTQTGYAAHTPACDGERIYCFFGVSGVVAFDMNGEQLWEQSVGTGFDGRHWGTAASPVVCGDLVIVNAASESHTLYGLDKKSGEVRWKFEDPGLQSTWSTPIVVKNSAGKDEVVLPVPGEVWSFDPESGKRLWFCKGTDPNSSCASLVTQGDVVYAIIGRRGGSALAIRTGGEGDVTGTHVVWSQNIGGSIGTPVLHDGLIYNFAGGMAECIDAETGKSVEKRRLEAPKAAAADAEVRPAAAEEPAGGEGRSAGDSAQASDGQQQNQGERPEGNRGFGPPREGGFGPPGGGRRFGRGGGGDWFRSQDYSSPVIADGKLYFARRGGEVQVFSLGRDFKQLAANKFSDEADYSATPAISGGDVFIRSSKKLYCVSNVGQL